MTIRKEGDVWHLPNGKTINWKKIGEELNRQLAERKVYLVSIEKPEPQAWHEFSHESYERNDERKRLLKEVIDGVRAAEPREETPCQELWNERAVMRLSNLQADWLGYKYPGVVSVVEAKEAIDNQAKYGFNAKAIKEFEAHLKYIAQHPATTPTPEQNTPAPTHQLQPLKH